MFEVVRCGPGTRVVCTGTPVQSFEELSQILRSKGFEVDHYHGSDSDDAGEVYLTHVDAEGYVTGGDMSHATEKVTPQHFETLVADEYH